MGEEEALTEKLNPYVELFWIGMSPDPEFTVSEWADKHRVLSSRSAAEAGQWKTDRTPYLKEIMDALSPSSPIEEVIFMKGSQVGGTEAGSNWIGFIIDVAGGPMMAVQPTVDLAKRNSKQRIDPLIEESERLRSKVKTARSRDSGNTVLVKEFPGGILVMTGANSAVGLRSLPAKFLFLDEVDAYPGDVDGEGDPVVLAKARTRTFARRKLYLCSTPTIDGRSRIKKEFDASDQRYFNVPCPHCQKRQHLKFGQLKWPKGEPKKAKYRCEHCNLDIEERFKPGMLSAGEWIAENPGAKDGKVAGFHLSALYAPLGWFSWGDIAALWIDCQGSQEKLRGFINTVLGEVWKSPGEAPDSRRIYEQREHYPAGKVPTHGTFLTCGVDVQKGRVEAEIVAWGQGKQSWSVDYRVFHGETETPEGDAFTQLDALLEEQFEHVSGSFLPIRMMAIDSGYNTQTVYNWARKYSVSRVIAIKGSESQPMILNTGSIVDVQVRGHRLRRGFKVFTVGVNLLKAELYSWLRLLRPVEGELFPPGFCHFPEYGLEYFEQLAAEQLVIRNIRGYSKQVWEKTRERNEALDCRIYARAAAAALGMDRFKNHQWATLASEVGATLEVPPLSLAPKIEGETESRSDETPPKIPPPKLAAPLQRRKSRYL